MFVIIRNNSVTKLINYVSDKIVEDKFAVKYDIITRFCREEFVSSCWESDFLKVYPAILMYSTSVCVFDLEKYMGWSYYSISKCGIYLLDYCFSSFGGL